jgi:segregation and condensation protein A
MAPDEPDISAAPAPQTDAVVPEVSEPSEPQPGAGIPAAHEASPGTLVTEGDRCEIRLPVFEGPLDLLLHLIRKESIDIYDIPIARITEQYLEYIRLMDDLNVNVAGEFLEMAATLIYIKSRMLLPAEPVPEGEMAAEEDPRAELVERLLEYERFKSAAQTLYQREQLESGMWSVSRYHEVVPPGEELVSVSLFDLLDAFRGILQRIEDRTVVEVDREAITVAEKIAEIEAEFSQRRKVRFSELAGGRFTRSHLVVLFIAILELVRMRCIRVRQDDLFADFWVIRHADVPWTINN